MTMTTMLVDDGYLYDFDLHEARLKQGCEALGLPWQPLQIPSITGRARLKITISTAGIEYHTEPCPPYSSAPLSLTVRVDEGLRLKSPASLTRRAWGEVLTINDKQIVLQASCANLFWLDDTWMTPCFETLPVVKGTALQRLLPMKQVLWSLNKLLERRPYLFLCNAIREIVPISAIDKTPLPLDSALLSRLLGQYRQMRYAHKL